MPYPVLPPDPPPLVYALPSEPIQSAEPNGSVSASPQASSPAPIQRDRSPTVLEARSQPSPLSHSPQPEVSAPIASTSSLDRTGPNQQHEPLVAGASALGPPLVLDTKTAVRQPRSEPIPEVAFSSTALSGQLGYQPVAQMQQPSSANQPAPEPTGEVSYGVSSSAFNLAQVEPSEAPASDAPAILEIPTDPQLTPDAIEAPPTSTTPVPPGEAVPVTLEQALVELRANRQEYDEQRRVFTAEGDVVMRYGGAILDADLLRVNLVDRIAVAEGNVALTRGEQVLRGDRFEYNFVQGAGTVQSASGEIFLPTTGQDFALPLPTDAAAITARPPSDRITANQPVTGVSNPGEFGYSLGSGGGQRGEVQRLRFEAEQIEFTPEGWIAQNVRITNDPFSPPELELRAREAQLNRLGPLQDEVLLSRPRLVFDQGLEVPLLRDRFVLDRREREPALFDIGFDGEDRGGLFVESSQEIFASQAFRLTVTPQFFIQRAITDAGFGSLDSYGLVVELEGAPTPTTFFEGQATFTSLDPGNFEDELRASLRLQQLIGTELGPHTVAVEYSYRDRLFNGSLGFQDVRQSLGAVVISPVIPLGDTGIGLSYQAGAQYITAETDRLDLLDPSDGPRGNISLGRFQASAALSRGFLLWQGEPLPPTPTEGLKYTPRPLVPYLQAFAGLRGVATAYTNGETQNTLTGTVGIQGQLGHFSRPYLDYTAFNLAYSDALSAGDSPFLFDRYVDQNVLTAGVVQQIYGPFRFGFQTAINLDTGDDISTDYILEYSRRTYGITLRYNPQQEIGSLNLRISDFNWNGSGDTFGGSGVRTVEGGVVRSRD